MTCEAVKSYAIPVNDDGTLADRPDVELDRRIRRYMLDNGIDDYEFAFDCVRADPKNAEIVRAYAKS